jgi:hypothetical protein
MAMEPISIFSRRIDPSGVEVLLRSLDPWLQVTGPTTQSRSRSDRPRQPAASMG